MVGLILSSRHQMDLVGERGNLLLELPGLSTRCVSEEAAKQIRPQKAAISSSSTAG